MKCAIKSTKFEVVGFQKIIVYTPAHLEFSTAQVFAFTNYIEHRSLPGGSISLFFLCDSQEGEC